jgi:hypothetical protein
MQLDIFSQVIVPVTGGLGIFMLGPEFMSNGIQALALLRDRRTDIPPRYRQGRCTTRRPCRWSMLILHGTKAPSRTSGETAQIRGPL